MQNLYIRLFTIAFLLMFLFQLEARLFSYVYLFHEGLLLIQAMLLGGGLLLLIQEILPQKYNRYLDTYTPLLLVLLFLIQQFVFYYFNLFIVDFVALSVLFAFIFREVTNLLTMRSNVFYSLELLGSFVGVALYAFLVQYYLEEPLLVFGSSLLLFYAFVYTPTIQFRVAILSTTILLIGGYAIVMKQSSIPILLQCWEGSTSYGYKAACLNDMAGLKPTASFSHLKGRSDVYIRTDAHNLRFLEVKNNGYRVSAANQEQYRKEDWFDLLEMRIPKLAYPDDAVVLSVGAGAGSYVQALYDYIEHPNITAVEIDQTVEDIYASNLFSEFLPGQESYEIVYEEGRRYMTLNDTTYDLITIAIEGINSSLPRYTDERTGLLYTKEALATYISRLRPGGYLVLEQYYPQTGGGPEMGVKFMRTLQAASGVSETEFQNNLYMYTWAFHNQPNAQRFFSAVYKPNGFTDVDITTIRSWIKRLQTTDLGGGLNPHQITTVHEPSKASNPVVYDEYFNPVMRAQIDAVGNTEAISDERPFRHLVTTLPLPPYSYAVFGFMAVSIILVIQFVWQRFAELRSTHIAFSIWLGLVTFGLQYLLFYKTAAFLDVSLIFFSIFLLLPLLFGALGGYVSTLLPRRYDWLLATIILIVAYVLLTVDVFLQSKLFILTLVASMFVIAGVLFPRLLEAATSEREKRVIYAVNLIAGGFALMIMITLHATIGWSAAFMLTIIGMLMSIVFLRYV